MKNSVGHCFGCEMDAKAADIEGQIRRAYKCQISSDGVISPIKIFPAQMPATSFSVPEENKIGVAMTDTNFGNNIESARLSPMTDFNAGLVRPVANTTKRSLSEIGNWLKKNPIAAAGAGLGLIYLITKK